MKKLFFLYLISCLLLLKAEAQEDLKDGFNRFFYPNGQVSSEGFILEGKPDGYWKTFYVTGIVKSEGLRTNFQLDSTWTFYSQSGTVEERIDYKYGKRNGYTLKYSAGIFARPVLVSKELYVNDNKEGIAYYYYPDGDIKEEISFVNAKKQGPGREYDEKGKLIILLEYHNNYIISRQRVNRLDAQGKKQGTWIVLFPSGKVNKEMYYVDDQLSGIYKEFNEKGNLILSMKYREGKIIEDKEKIEAQDNIDFRREVNEKGILVSSGSFLEGKAVGVHRVYTEQGKVRGAKIYNDSGFIMSEGIVDETGSKEGDWKDFYSTEEPRATGLYKDNQQTGRWNFYYRNGKKEQEGSYLRGLYDGLWTWYYENGNIWREESYFNGKEDGLSTEYDEMGNIITKGEYINGEKEGYWFYKVNDHTEEGNYQTGLKSGVWKYYYEDGVLQFEGKFEQDQPQGKHKYYYPSGVMSEERYYVRGVRERNWKKYDELGKLEMTITYNRDQEYRINGVKISLPKGSIQTIN